MASPKSDVTLRPDLGAVAYEYALEASLRGFVGLSALPVFETTEKSAEYPVIPTEAFLKLEETKRASRSAYGRTDWEFDDDTYSCVEQGWEEAVDDGEAKLYRNFFDAEEVAVMRCVDVILRKQEKRISDAIMNTSNFSVNNVSTKWSVTATATPRSDVQDGVSSIRAATGLEPNTLIISRDTFENIMLGAAWLSHVQYTNPVLLETFETQKKLMAQYLGIGQVLVGGAIYDSAKKGAATSTSSIWPNAKGMLAVVASNANDLKEPCLGRTFLWTEDTPEIYVTEQYREEQTRSEIYRVRQFVDEEFVCKAAGYLLGNLA